LASVFAEIPFVSNYAFWVAIAAYVFLYWGGSIGAYWPGILSLFLLMLALVGVFIEIPFVSHYAFWFAIAAYVIRDWTFNDDVRALLIWTGALSLLVMMLAVVGVFIEIPFVSNYAFWFLLRVDSVRIC
jgi:hypothetical protein